MPDLYDVLADRVTTWRLANYPHERFPAIGEILDFATDAGSDDGSGQLRYLRAAQLRALETYWFLRLVEEGILAPSIDDWRAMVDSVAIDTAYDGAVFDVELIDIPARRSDLVDGAYELDLPTDHGDRPAAVRITDMLGEEVLVVEDRP